jgi:hypothetical protein
VWEPLMALATEALSFMSALVSRVSSLYTLKATCEEQDLQL